MMRLIAAPPSDCTSLTPSRLTIRIIVTSGAIRSPLASKRTRPIMPSFRRVAADGFHSALAARRRARAAKYTHDASRGGAIDPRGSLCPLRSLFCGPERSHAALLLAAQMSSFATAGNSPSRPQSPLHLPRRCWARPRRPAGVPRNDRPDHPAGRRAIGRTDRCAYPFAGEAGLRLGLSSIERRVATRESGRGLAERDSRPEDLQASTAGYRGSLRRRTSTLGREYPS
jgi:hypothetical protein